MAITPEGHGALAAVGELEDGAARQRGVVGEGEDAHLVEIEAHEKLSGRQHAQALVSYPSSTAPDPAAAALSPARRAARGGDTGGLDESGHEARLGRLHQLEQVLHHCDHLADRAPNRLSARTDAIVHVARHL